MEVLHRETGDTKYRPSVLLGRMVDAGWMGKKTGNFGRAETKVFAMTTEEREARQEETKKGPRQ